jgi:hypothetical protein
MKKVTYTKHNILSNEYFVGKRLDVGKKNFENKEKRDRLQIKSGLITL